MALTIKLCKAFQMVVNDPTTKQRRDRKNRKCINEDEVYGSGKGGDKSMLEDLGSTNNNQEYSFAYSCWAKWSAIVIFWKTVHHALKMKKAIFKDIENEKAATGPYKWRCGEQNFKNAGKKEGQAADRMNAARDPTSSSFTAPLMTLVYLSPQRNVATMSLTSKSYRYKLLNPQLWTKWESWKRSPLRQEKFLLRQERTLWSSSSHEPGQHHDLYWSFQPVHWPYSTSSTSSLMQIPEPRISLSVCRLSGILAWTLEHF